MIAKPVNHDNGTVKRILGAALRLFTRDGYHGASLKDIADEAGVAKSLLHYHFASKEQLLFELESVYFRRVQEQVRARLASHPQSLEGALQTMDDLFSIIVETREYFPFILEMWRAGVQSPEVRAGIVDFERDFRELFKEGVRSALGPLTARLRIPPDRLAEILHAMFAGCEVRLFLVPDVRRIKRVYEDFKTLLLHGVVMQEGE